MNIQTVLQKVPLFSQLPDALLDELVQSGQTLHLAPDKVVCHEGDETDAMYVILDGRVQVYKTDEDGNRVDIGVLAPGDFFGEMALLDSQPRSATVSCLAPCHLFMLEKGAFLALLTNPQTQQMAFSILSALVKRFRLFMEKYFEEELTRRMLQAEAEAERHRSLAQMVAGVAHELNTPLGIVNTAVDMIAKRVRSDALSLPLRDEKAAVRTLDEVKEAADLACRNMSRAHKLVQNFKKISVRQLTDTRETIDLAALVRDILELFKINADQAKLDIKVYDNLPADQKNWTGYPGYLTQVLTNLLVNIEYHAYPDQTGGVIEIELKADNERDTAVFVLTIQDFGQGIAPNHLPQLFTPFFTTGRSRGGTGLGLAIVHNIVTEAFKGHIKVESAPSEGCKVTVVFPQKTPD